ncbi:tripartite tricarboxylate transporter TctB family protein [Allofournierella sp.]|uniref:tripartite tricarboxylate transporter TctB family protein n=1 Tax=Allofournierella sp. TaxID=1940256 RepID=UPI003AB6C862
MKKECGWKKCSEGAVVLALGVACLLLALGVPDNPIRQPNPVLDFVTQARFLPLMGALVITALGAAMTAKQLGGALATAHIPGEELTRAGVLVGLTAAYAALVLNLGFVLPTAGYLAACLFYLNRGARRWYTLVLFTAIFTGVATLLVPRLLNIALP